MIVARFTPHPEVLENHRRSRRIQAIVQPGQLCCRRSGLASRVPTRPGALPPKRGDGLGRAPSMVRPACCKSEMRSRLRRRSNDVQRDSIKRGECPYSGTRLVEEMDSVFPALSHDVHMVAVPAPVVISRFRLSSCRCRLSSCRCRSSSCRCPEHQREEC